MLSMEIAKRSGMTLGEWTETHADAWIESWSPTHHTTFTNWSNVYRNATFKHFVSKYWDMIDNPNSAFANAVRDALETQTLAQVANKYKVPEADLYAQIQRWVKAMGAGK